MSIVCRYINETNRSYKREHPKERERERERERETDAHSRNHFYFTQVRLSSSFTFHTYTHIPFSQPVSGETPPAFMNTTPFRQASFNTREREKLLYSSPPLGLPRTTLAVVHVLRPSMYTSRAPRKGRIARKRERAREGERDPFA